MLVGVGAAIAGFAFSRSLLVSCVLIFISGVTLMASASLMLSLVQLIVSDQMRGRVMSVYNLAFRLGIPVGSLTLGKVIPLVGVTTALAVSGLALIGIGLYFLAVMRDAMVFQRTITQGDRTTP
jgi:sugar phosphate permease